jgi:curved DNA-binding protein CbpA
MRSEGSRYTPAQERALTTLGLAPGADRKTLRRKYTELLRRYHPDHNGGDRSHEHRLQQVVDAYHLLRKEASVS